MKFFLFFIMHAISTHADDALPLRLILGQAENSKQQIWIFEEAGSYYVKLGEMAEALRSPFSRLPYPLDYIEFRMPKDYFCYHIFEGCNSSETNIHIRTIGGFNGEFRGIASIALSKDALGGYRLVVSLENSKSKVKQSLGLAFLKSQVVLE